jgi:glyoxylase-like metal-dependent hydrolase (beta-lactamase superfamily II)
MVQQLALGAARIYALNLGTLMADLADWLGVAPAERGADAALFAEALAVPVQSMLIVVPGATVLVDACDPLALPTIEAVPRNYQPPPDVRAQLFALGVPPEAVDFVVVTHLHTDHYLGLVHDGDGELLPCFPRARHIVGRADWEATDVMRATPGTAAARVLGPLWRAGLIELADGPRTLAAGIEVLPLPGETPGHMAVRAETAGQRCTAIGDLFHHEIEVAHPEWQVRWADPSSSARSRAALLAADPPGDDILLATHIAGFGRLRRAAGLARWEGL